MGEMLTRLLVPTMVTGSGADTQFVIPRFVLSCRTRLASLVGQARSSELGDVGYKVSEGIDTKLATKDRLTRLVNV